nr:MAG TPA: hypothetical protein [Caudoviricetes sp.]
MGPLTKLLGKRHYQVSSLRTIGICKKVISLHIEMAK